MRTCVCVFVLRFLLRFVAHFVCIVHRFIYTNKLDVPPATPAASSGTARHSDKKEGKENKGKPKSKAKSGKSEAKGKEEKQSSLDDSDQSEGAQVPATKMEPAEFGRAVLLQAQM